MRRTQLLSTALVVCALIFSLEGCGKYKKGGVSSTADIKATSSSTPCGPAHTMNNYTPVWEYYNCGPVDELKVTAYTANEAGKSLGPTPVNRGKLHLKYTKLHNDIISHKETFGILFMANGNSNYEANWQWMSYQVGGGYTQSRLVIQRFDGTCPKFCEVSDITDEIQFWDYADIWQFDCEWDTFAGHLSCVVQRVGSNIKFITVNDPKGVYNGLRYLGVGKSAYDGHLPSYEAIVSDFKLTIFSDS